METCVDCNRKFRADRLERHSKVCKKVFLEKRKKFDSQKARKPEELLKMEQQEEMNNR